MQNIEVELRSVISRTRYDELLAFFKKNGKLLETDRQETWYFSGPNDLRIQKNKSGAHIKLKKGQLFDEQREEVFLKVPGADFEKLEDFFQALGLQVDIKWLRNRYTFAWQGIEVMLDDTKGYGFVVEFEKMCSAEEKEKTLQILKERMKQLNIQPTPREQLARRHTDYKLHWREWWK